MQERSKTRTVLPSLSRPVTAVSVMAAGAVLLALGLPADWIDLAALALAAVTAWPADAVPLRPTPRKLRRKIRVMKRRTTRDTR
ncbi:hypothetical protein [Streptomyces sp. NPDC059814]|uniref:hypothetical protein n=1 Tax=Streptomyces sp. NPDC059814 TaxID=3346959 RepID=UPI00364BDCBE